MTVLNIVTPPADVLRQKAKAIKQVDKNTQTLIDDMVETMRAAPGVGLAAPQVGVSARIIVVEWAPDEEEEDEEPAEDQEQKPKVLFTLINPEIIRATDQLVTGVEGCLSIPRMIGEVERHEGVVIKALNRHGQPVKIKADGWLARIFQHEIDHLNGILFTDRAIALSVIDQHNPEEIEAQQHESLHSALSSDQQSVKQNAS